MEKTKKWPNSYPGTDDVTGWPLAPSYPCDKDFLGLPEGEVKCHLRLGPGPMVCIYEPGGCPFFGKYPKLGGNEG